MNNDELSALINKVIIDVISDAVIDLMNQRTILPKNIVVVFSGNATLCYSSVMEQLSLLPNNISCSLLFSHTALAHFSRQHLPLISPLTNVQIINTSNYSDSEILNYDLIVLPELSLNSLAKSVNNIADNLVTEFVQHALLNNKKIIATFDYFYQQHNLPISYRHGIEQQLAKLISYNVQVIKMTEIASKINTEWSLNINPYAKTEEKSNVEQINYGASVSSQQHVSKVISSSYVRCHDPVKPLYLFKDALVTPLAMDIIKQKNIRIIKE